jgi:hypothetical protein
MDNTPQKPKLELGSRESLNRPAWTQDDLHAYRHKHTRGRIVRDYYANSKGVNGSSS